MAKIIRNISKEKLFALKLEEKKRQMAARRKFLEIHGFIYVNSKKVYAKDILSVCPDIFKLKIDDIKKSD